MIFGALPIVGTKGQDFLRLCYTHFVQFFFMCLLQMPQLHGSAICFATTKLKFLEVLSLKR